MTAPDPGSLAVAIDWAFARLEASGGELARVPEELARTLVVVVSAQGVIENGGLAYFFGLDWPGTPPYALFVSAYLAIGAVREAALLEEALAVLALAQPERDLAARRAALAGPAGARLADLDRRWGDVEAKLAEHVARHSRELP